MTVKILHFGLARNTEEDIVVTQITEVGIIKNTLHHMAPEQARVFAIATLAGCLVLAIAFTEAGISAWISLPCSLLVALLDYAGMTRRIRRRHRILAQPFLIEWEEILQPEVIFFRALEACEQSRFRRDLQIFLGEKLITGIGFDLGATRRALAGAARSTRSAASIAPGGPRRIRAPRFRQTSTPKIHDVGL